MPFVSTSQVAMFAYRQHASSSPFVFYPFCDLCKPIRSKIQFFFMPQNADSILFWNNVALEANRVSHTNNKMEQTGPTLSARALAMVHLAMYNAYAIVKKMPVLFFKAEEQPSSEGASARAAVAAAAHILLAKLYPSQKAFFDRSQEQAPVDEGDRAKGYHIGSFVANAIWQKRKNDPDARDDGYVFSTARYAHRVDPDNPEQGFYGPNVGNTPLFASGKHELDAIHPESEMYINALKEVRGLGISPSLTGTVPNAYGRRSAEQTMIGIYWGYDGAKGLGTPPRLYNQIVRDVAEAQNNSEDKNAQLFMLVNVAMADAGTLAWREKYRHNFWRPVVGIREHDQTMGWPFKKEAAFDPDCDPGWLPLGAPATNSANPLYAAAQTSPVFPYNQITTAKAKNFTPNFPAYPSGHATFGAAALYIARMFYGKHEGDTTPDDLFKDRSFVSEELNGVNQDNNGTIRPRHGRQFPDGLWQMIEENGRSRVYLGVHWVFDAFAEKDGRADLSQRIGGVRLGLDIAKDIFEKSGIQPSTAQK